MGRDNFWGCVFVLPLGLAFLPSCMEAKRDLTGCHIVASDYARCIQEQPDPEPESQSRFKVEVGKIEFLEHDVANKLVHGQLTLRLVPTVQSDTKTTNIILGLLSLHDPSKISKNKTGGKSLTCQESPSCVDFKTSIRVDNPTLVVGGEGSTGVPIHWSFKYPDTARRLRLRWEFYQKEHDGELHCEVIKDKPYPSDGIPFVHAVNSAKEQKGTWCYGDIEVYDFRAPHLTS